jgi:hypothetical protein
LHEKQILPSEGMMNAQNSASQRSMLSSVEVFEHQRSQSANEYSAAVGSMSCKKLALQQP